MAFTILELSERQDTETKSLLSHNGNAITATIHDLRPEETVIGKELIAEIEWSGLRASRTVAEFQSDSSGIWQAQDGIHLMGVIHNIIQIDESNAIADVYIENGADFFTIHASELGAQLPAAGTGIHLVVERLAIYPSHR